MFNSTKHKLGALLLGLALVLTGCGGSSDRGGFSNPIDIVAVQVRTADGSNRMDANLGLEDCGLETRKTIIVELFDQEGQLFPAELVSVDVVPGTADGAICTPIPVGEEDDDPVACGPLLGPFSRATFEASSGIQTMEFISAGSAGTVQLVASAQDPNSGQQVSGTLELEVVQTIPIGPAVTSMTFTGPFVNAVLEGANALGLQLGEDLLLQDGSYQRLISVVMNDENGNPPVCTGRLVNFFLVDGPLVGYPAQGPGTFAIAGPDGNPEEGGVTFTVPNGTGGFDGSIINGPAVRPLNDRLILDGRQEKNPGASPQPNNRIFTGIWRVESVLGDDTLTIEQNVVNPARGTPPFPFNPALTDSGFSVPYLIGSALNGNVLRTGVAASSDAVGAGVANTILTYPVSRVGQTAALMACTVFPQDLDEDGRITLGSADRKTCAILNTCNASGENCGSVYLPATDGSDIILTADPTVLSANSTSDVTLCLSDRNLTPLPGTPIFYNFEGNLGSASITVNGNPASSGAVVTGGNGCAVATVASSGQAPGSESIFVTFDADNSNPEEAVTVEIRGPGAGNLLASLDCGGAVCIDQDPENLNVGGVTGVPAGGDLSCTIDLLLLDDRGGVISDIVVTHTSDQQLNSISYDPAFGNFGITGTDGAVAASVSANTLALPTISFAAGAATNDVSLALPDCPEGEDVVDDDPPVATLGGGNVELAPGESTSYTVLLSEPASSELTIGIAASGATAQFTVPSSVTIAEGASAASFTVTASDTVTNGATVQVQLLSGTGYTLGSPASAEVMIVVEEPVPPAVSLIGGNVTLAQGGSADYAVTLSEPISSSLSINFLVTGATDQITVSPSTPLEIPAGEASGTITATAGGSASDGAAVTITIISGTGYTVGETASGTATVVVPPEEPTE